MTRLITLCILLLATPILALAQFTHPGGLHKQSDLERMRSMVQAGVSPYADTFDLLKAHPSASATYDVRGDSSWTTVARGGTNGGAFESDATAAYLNALMWAITQNDAHAQKAVEIFSAWTNITNVQGGGTEALNAGLYAWKLVEAAEIIKSTYSGWQPQDIDAFKAMLVYPGYSTSEPPASLSTTNGSFYWRIYQGDPGRHGNQDLVAWRAMISMAVFLDNPTMYDRALNYFKGLDAPAGDIPYVAGPSTPGDQLGDNLYFTSYRHNRQDDVPNWGYNGVLEHYIWENGQNQESSRDQQHAYFGLGLAAGIAEVAWTQGDSVWNSLDNRLLKGFEFTSRYNTSYEKAFEDQPTPWEPDNFIQRIDRTGRWFSKTMNPYYESDFERVSRGNFEDRPIYEQAWAHFQGRMGLGGQATWTKRGRDTAIELYGLEQNGWSLDHPGWGGLTFRRPNFAAGDPLSGFTDDGTPNYRLPTVPATIEAEHFDYFADIGNGRTYFDTSSSAAVVYRTDERVDLTQNPHGNYDVDQLADGEWLTYTLSVSEAGDYYIYARYTAPNAGTQLRATSYGVKEDSASVSTAFTNLAPSQNPGHYSVQNLGALPLEAGTQALRLFAKGNSNNVALDALIITSPLTPPAGFTLCALERAECLIHADNTEVAYGTSGQFNYTTASASIRCDNSTFADPAPGKTKACFVKSPPEQEPAMAGGISISACALLSLMVWLHTWLRRRPRKP